MLYHANQVRARHAYFESEFMDAVTSKNPLTYRYNEMVTDAAIETLAREIVVGIVEFLLDPQANLDPVTYNQKKPLGGLW
jgi:hypothetical protein